jgi:PIN domain nuclease of toxin-antitoxin system
MSKGFLLDTCAIIWAANNMVLSVAAGEAINGVGQNERRLFVSAASAWEIGMLISRGKISTTEHALAWFKSFVGASGAEVSDATADVMIAATYLPAPLHKDPMDRIIIATAREHDLTIITRDRAILAYGVAGHVKTLAC